MSEFSKLVDIKFEDATSYTQSFTEDILCIPFVHHWGPTHSTTPVNRQEFLQYYDQGVNNLKSWFSASNWLEYYSGYVNILRAFDAGIGRVLPMRLDMGSQVPFCSVNLSYDRTYGPVSCVFKPNDIRELTITNGSNTSYPFWGFKYQGVPSFYNEIGKFEVNAIGIHVTFYLANEAKNPYKFLYKDAMKVQLICTSDDSVEIDTEPTAIRIIEEFTGVIEDNVYYNGQNVSIRSLIESESNYFLLSPQFEETWKFLKGFGSDVYASDTIIYSSISADDFGGLFDDNDLAYYTDDFDVIEPILSDPDLCNFSLLYAPNLTGVDIAGHLLNIVTSRKDANVLFGFSTSLPFTYENITGSDDTSFKSIRTKAFASDNSFFAFYLAARETYQCMGYEWTLDGCAAWAGRMATVAQSSHLNQMPSARVYGAVSAQLTNTLTFDKVLDLHELGCNSIYQSAQGPTIFGIKALYYNQASYWGKANVSRVTARLIKYITPEVLNVIHTEVVSDPIQRAKFTAAMNNILNEFKSAGNIKDQSYVITDDSINSDAQTKGGEILNVIFVIYFKKLTEKVQIKFIATDSSVDVQIS